MRIRTFLLRTAIAFVLACGTDAAADAPDLLPLAGEAKLALDAIPASKLAALQMDKIAAQDALADTKGAPGGFRYAVPAPLAVDATRDGGWRSAKDGRAVWHWRVRSPDALHLNFGFDRFFLPQGASLRILAGEGPATLGPYTSADNNRHRQLWTAPLFANEAIIELAVPESLRDGVELHLAQVGVGYRGFGLQSKHCKSGACNTDVACLGANDPWNQPRRAVASYSLGGGRLCTGSLLNNTRNDRRMLFVTATHCEVTAANAASLVVFWNFESPTCRTPGSSQSGSNAVVGPTNQTQNGATLLAATNNPFAGAGSAESRSDFTLLELTQPANPAFNLHWAGWDRRALAPFCGPNALCASIHHPDGDEKRITFSEAPMVQGNIAQAAGVHWTVFWDPTPPIAQLPNLPAPLPTTLPPSVTEPGSSGSPLYNAQQRLVGVLSGGASACGVAEAQLNDEYGQLARAWDGLGTAATRVRDALDPVSGGSAEALDGIGACTPPTVEFGTPVEAIVGSSVAFFASASGAGPFTMEFDFDDDGVFDTRATDVAASATRRTTYPTRGGVSGVVRVTDRNNCSVTSRRAIVVRGPLIGLSAQAPEQVCGNGDADIDPGERWRVPVTATNTGDFALQNGVAIFTRGQGTVAGGSVDGFGNRVLDSTGSSCPYSYVDLSAEPLLPLTGGNDDGRATAALDLGPNGVPFYGATVRRLVMSTNGYLATDDADNGQDFENACGAAPGDGGRLNVLHDDLVVKAGGGLRRRYFASCPRAADTGGTPGCTVFQWSNLGRFVQGAEPEGSADFQAVVYDNGQVVYQYRAPDPQGGGSASIGIQDGATALQYGCNVANRVAANRAVCFFPPNAQPPSLQAPRVVLTASRDLSNLAIGASATREVEFSVDPATACGAPLAIRYVGTVDSVSHSLRPATLVDRRVGGNDGVCSAQPQCFPDASTQPLPARRDGSFANFSRLGNGMAAINYTNGNQWTFGGGWFTATRDHLPTWYTVQGAFGDRRLSNQAEVQIFRFRQTSSAPFAVQGSVAGSGQITYITPTDLVFTWTLDGVSAGERMVLAYTGPRGMPERTGAWFNPAESGWGVLLEDAAPIPNVPVEQTVVNYIFDGAGRPTWTLGAVPGINGGTAQHRVFFVHCPGCPAIIDPPTATAGSSTIAFGGLTSGTYGTTINLPAPLSGTWVRNNLPLQMLSPPQPAQQP